MPHPRTMNPEHQVGLPVLDVAVATVGTIESVYLDVHTDAPEWAAVTAGMVGGHAALVPLAVAFTAQDGVCVPYSTDLIASAPHHDPAGQQQRCAPAPRDSVSTW